MTNILWPINGYNRGPISQVQPFVYSDAVSILDILYKLKEYLTDEIVPILNNISVEVDAAIAGMLETVDAALDNQNELTDQKIADLTTYVNTSIESIINNSIEVQDPVVAGLLADSDSESSQANNAAVASAINSPANPVAQALDNHLVNVQMDIISDEVETVDSALGGAVDRRYQDIERRLAPSYVNADGIDHAGNVEYDPIYHLYFESSEDMRLIRQYVSFALAGTVSAHCLCIGDSKTFGNGTGFLNSYPMALRGLLGASLGMSFAHAALAAWGDPQWSNVTGFTNTGTSLHLNASAGVNTIKFSASSRSTGLRFWYDAPGVVADATVSIDGGTPVPLVASGTMAAPGATAPFSYMDFTGLSDSSHTLEFTLTLTSGGFYFRGIEGLHSANKLTVSNAGLSASTIAQWNAVNDSRLSLYNIAPGLVSQSASFKFVLINLGTNSSPDEIAGYRAIVSNLRVLGYKIMIIVPGGTVNNTTRSALKRALYDIARETEIPLTDFNDLIGNSIAYDRGYMYDGLHENARGYRYEAITLRKILS